MDLEVIYLTSHVPQAVGGSRDHARRSRRHARCPNCRIKRSPTPASASREAALAWSLADTAGRCLDAVQHNNVFVAIGSGETFTAIFLLLDAITCKGFLLEGGLGARLLTWLKAYTGHDDEPRVRRMIYQAMHGYYDEPSVIEKNANLHQ